MQLKNTEYIYIVNESVEWSQWSQAAHTAIDQSGEQSSYAWNVWHTLNFFKTPQQKHP